MCSVDFSRTDHWVGQLSIQKQLRDTENLVHVCRHLSDQQRGTIQVSHSQKKTQRKMLATSNRNTAFQSRFLPFESSTQRQ